MPRFSPLLLLVAWLVLSPLQAAAQDVPLGEELGSYKVTYYWVVFEDDFQGRPAVPLYDMKGKVLAVVSEPFARRVAMEGTGVLRDGRVVNLHDKCRFGKHGWCFLMVDRKKAPFGYGSHVPLHPFRTLAVPEKILPRGAVVYIPAFDGMPLPGDEGGFEFHDGCFVVEDTGWSLNGRHIDIFALSEPYYRNLHAQVDERNKVEMYADSPLCPDTSNSLYNPEAWAQEFLAR